MTVRKCSVTVRRYVAWLRDTIIPQAEALTPDATCAGAA
jgi:hypothetical protein